MSGLVCGSQTSVAEVCVAEGFVSGISPMVANLKLVPDCKLCESYHYSGLITVHVMLSEGVEMESRMEPTHNQEVIVKSGKPLSSNHFKTHFKVISLNL